MKRLPQTGLRRHKGCMDPDANWTEQVELLKVASQRGRTRDEKARSEELRQALRTWIRMGGFPPKEWKS